MKLVALNSTSIKVTWHSATPLDQSLWTNTGDSSGYRLQYHSDGQVVQSLNITHDQSQYIITGLSEWHWDVDVWPQY